MHAWPVGKGLDPAIHSLQNVDVFEPIVLFFIHNK